jgi:hypothetical protein
MNALDHAKIGQGDTRDILDVIGICSLFAWLTDTRDWKRLAELFTDELDVDYTSFAGGEPVRLQATALISAWEERLSKVSVTQHLITNHLVAVDGDQATCVAQVHAQHMGSAPFGDQNVIVAGHYTFGMVRSDSGWRINSLTLTATWASGNLAVLSL